MYFCQLTDISMRYILFAFSWLFVLNTNAQKIVADKIVATVGNKIILQSDIENSISDARRQGMDIPANANCLTLEQALGIKAMVVQAEKDSLPVSEEEIETDIDNRVRYFIQSYGSKEEFERVAGKSIFQFKEEMKEGFRDQKLAMAMRSSITKDVRITPKEVKEYYDKIPADSLKFYESEVEIGQIIIYPKASREAEEYAIEQLKEFKSQIEGGSRDMKTLASLYSDDPASKQNAGLYEINRNSRDWDPAWLAKAFTLKEGQVSSPFKTQFGYHIIQLISRLGDDAVVRHILKIPQITNIEISETVDKLDSVRALLIAGNIDFGTAVNQYSNDDMSKFTAGRVQGEDGSGFVTIDQLEKDMIPYLQTLKVGGYTQPVAFTNQQGKKGVRVIHLISQTDPHKENMRDDYNRIAARALQEKQESEIEKWFGDRIGSFNIRIAPEYQNCDAIHKWMGKSSTASK